MVQNNFGPIEGQGITKLYIPSTINTGKELLTTAIWVVNKKMGWFLANLLEHQVILKSEELSQSR